MGYEATRFIEKVDEEFYCSICIMVLKDPMQSPCEHLFCSECINEWLAADQSCPVERGPLKLEDLKPALRTVRNLMNKLEIKCDFESKGCVVIVKLENLEDHVGRCKYNGNEKVNCDKDCNIAMSLHQYETENYFKHLADLEVCHQEKIKSLREEQVNLRAEMIRMCDEARTRIKKYYLGLTN